MGPPEMATLVQGGPMPVSPQGSDETMPRVPSGHGTQGSGCVRKRGTSDGGRLRGYVAGVPGRVTDVSQAPQGYRHDL